MEFASCLMRLSSVLVTLVIEYEGAEALNEFRVRHLDADDVIFAPQKWNLSVFVSADRHRFPRVAVSHHGDLEADVGPERTVVGPPSAVAVFVSTVDGVRCQSSETV